MARTGCISALLCTAVSLCAALPLLLGCDSLTRDIRPAPSGELPELSAAKPAKAPEPTKTESPAPSADLVVKNPWVHILAVDHGIREDQGGKGHFLAGRGHGKHNGIDFLAPLGTPLLAACNGTATSGLSPSFGKWVQLVCSVPEEFSAGKPLYASLFYAHLDQTSVPRGEWRAVLRGGEVGKVGKTGNSRQKDIVPHVHFEVIVHGSLSAARAEHHGGKDQTNTPAADTFLNELSRRCVEPNGLRSDAGELRRKRRVDPFVTLACLSNRMPQYRTPEAPLREFAKSWDNYYRASGFDVNHGRRAL
jgi:murein DD-endopeptidase MepM/ murein hydrolase activator NlpD